MITHLSTKFNPVLISRCPIKLLQYKQRKKRTNQTVPPFAGGGAITVDLMYRGWSGFLVFTGNQAKKKMEMIPKLILCFRTYSNSNLCSSLFVSCCSVDLTSQKKTLSAFHLQGRTQLSRTHKIILHTITWKKKPQTK